MTNHDRRQNADVGPPRGGPPRVASSRGGPPCVASPKLDVIATDRVMIAGPRDLMRADHMAPYVWRDEHGAIRLLLRAVPQGDDTPSGTIWLGRSEDGLTFVMADTPLIAPGLSHLDTGGCEDPTVVRDPDTYTVFYTGVDAQGRGELLYAQGPTIETIAKKGVAYACSMTEYDTKEATIDRIDGDGWRLFFEYARDDQSRIGLATGDAPNGPWTQHDDPIEVRQGKWDDFHLSTGPLLRHEWHDPLMFYNGATQDARWGIGWATFDAATLALNDRCDEPLISPPPGSDDGAGIVFAASLLEEEDECIIQLYYSVDDRCCYRATIRIGPG